MGITAKNAKGTKGEDEKFAIFVLFAVQKRLFEKREILLLGIPPLPGVSS